MVKITFHTFTVGDVEDVEIYAAYPIHEWLKGEKGAWVKEHCADLTWASKMNDMLGWTISIRGSLKDRDATEYYLKFPDATS
jgi:hypothetical protein